MLSLRGDRRPPWQSPAECAQLMEIVSVPSQ